MISQLRHICDTAFDGLTAQAKIDLFHDTRQGFGSTALLLMGGATFGIIISS